MRAYAACARTCVYAWSGKTEMLIHSEKYSTPGDSEVQVPSRRDSLQFACGLGRRNVNKPQTTFIILAQACAFRVIIVACAVITQGSAAQTPSSDGDGPHHDDGVWEGIQRGRSTQQGQELTLRRKMMTRRQLRPWQLALTPTRRPLSQETPASPTLAFFSTST